MSLSVSSFPGAPQKKLPHRQTWQGVPPPERKRGFSCPRINLPSVSLLKGIRRLARAYVKADVIHQPVSVPPSRSQRPRPLSLSRSSIRPSSIVIDIIAVPHDDGSSPSVKSSYVDATGLDPIIELSSSPPLSPAAPSTPEHISLAVMTEPVKALHHQFPRSIGDRKRVPEKTASLPTQERNETVSVVGDSNPPAAHPSHASNRHSIEPSRRSHVTTPVSPTTAFPTAHSASARMQSVPVPSMKGRLGLRPVSTGAETAATTTMLPRRPRHKSETAIEGRRPFTYLDNDPFEGRNSGRNSTRQIPTSIRTSILQKPRQHSRGSRGVRRTLSASSSRKGKGSMGTGRSNSRSSSRSASPASGLSSVSAAPPLLSVHMLRMRSGSRVSSTPLLRVRQSSSRPASASAALQSQSLSSAPNPREAATPPFAHES
ncbi:hypothetical protein BC827DRAFT_1155085 [Russula dissimulans]|nr:hypothetical protein BC827DRAFT_1155085 [Russula dissimulans]